MSHKNVKKAWHIRKTWDIERENIFIAIWETKAEALKGPRKKMDIYREMTTELELRDIELEAKDVKSKIDFFAAKYKKYVEIKSLGGTLPPWPAFRRVQNILKVRSVRISASPSGSESSLSLKDKYARNLQQKEKSSKESQGKQKTETDNEMNFFIIWKQSIEKLRVRGGIKTNVYREMAAKLTKKGLSLSPLDVKLKIASLTSKYKKYKEHLDLEDDLPVWPLYEKIHKLLTELPPLREPSPAKSNASITSLEVSDPNKAKKTPKTWHSDDEMILINLWDKRARDLLHSSNKATVYREMASELATEGVRVSPMDVNCKIFNLSAKYRNYNKISKLNGSAPKWPLYERIHKIITGPRRGRPLVQIPSPPSSSLNSPESHSLLVSPEPVIFLEQEIMNDMLVDSEEKIHKTVIEKKAIKSGVDIEMEMSFLRLWGKYFRELQTENKEEKNEIYQEMAEELKIECIKLSPFNVKYKITNLTVKYKKHKEMLESGETPPDWLLYDVIDSIFNMNTDDDENEDEDDNELIDPVTGAFPHHTQDETMISIKSSSNTASPIPIPTSKSTQNARTTKKKSDLDTIMSTYEEVGESFKEYLSENTKSYEDAERIEKEKLEVLKEMRNDLNRLTNGILYFLERYNPIQ